MDPDRVRAAEPAQAPDYGADGVDLSLIGWMLTLTPADRLELLESRIDEIQRIRERKAK